MWSQYLHQITLHFPIVLSLINAAVGLWSLKEDLDPLRRFVRWVGWICLLLTTVAVASGLFAAQASPGGEWTEGLIHHRNLGLTAWVVMAVATVSFEWGMRKESTDWRKFAVGVWCVTAFAIIGAGHWGGSEQHRDVLPWTEQEQAPLD